MASEWVIDVDSRHFQQRVIEESFRRPVLVDFWAGWCQPCRILMPWLARKAEQAGGRFLLAKVDTEAEQALAVQFGIRGIPNVKLFRNGQVADEFTGVISEDQLDAFLARHLPRASDGELEGAIADWRAGHQAAAVAREWAEQKSAWQESQAITLSRDQYADLKDDKT